MIPDPFPEIRTRVELDALPPGTFVECVACVDHDYVIADVDPHEWITLSSKAPPEPRALPKGVDVQLPGCPCRHRQVDVMNADEEDEVCGAVATLPVFGRAPVDGLAGATVTCDEEPHEGGVHSGQIVVDGDYHGVYYWGPAYVPEMLFPTP
ncbi:hypothetical protein ABZZ74_52195 [Streptomyces sp. NPDC006476]|uniref:hypothetical protein n=1 Tax=Streptomyces sp. NPDC006476 TaxID=3157175 RepID=UPI0033AA4770